ncbi:MAG: class I adenylate-forming enzyme family protein, partial [Bacilli bacterium]|nr:class I adenylate-forming enzyme family protein [Bacilli bacterium]
DGRMWIHTEDLGYVDEDGMVFIDGRIKRLIIRQDGFKVYPFLIEEVIASHYAVEQCKVVGIPDLDYSQGSVPKAHIILKEGYEDSADLIQSEIKQLCIQKLPEYAQPREYKFRNAFPFTSIGKVDFMALENEDALKEKPKVMVKKLQR